MSVFEKVTDVGLEVPTDIEINKMIKELENEKQRREILNETNAINEILEVLHKHYDTLGGEWFYINDNAEFCLDTLMIAFEDYLRNITHRQLEAEEGSAD